MTDSAKRQQQKVAYTREVFARIHQGATVADIWPDAPAMLKAADSFAQLVHMRQKRKGPRKRPYIHHPRMVWYLVHCAGGTLTQQMAALLHDTIEDVHLNWPDMNRDKVAEQIGDYFGKDVLDLTLAATDPAELKDPNLSEVEKDAKKVAHQSAQFEDVPAVRLVKVADKVANTYDSVADRPSGWSDEKLLNKLETAEAFTNKAEELPQFLSLLLRQLADDLRKGAA